MKLDKRKAFWYAVMSMLLVVFITASIILIGNLTPGKNKLADYRSEVSSNESETLIELPDNPVDFTALKERNADVCGWIHIPGSEEAYGTAIDYPILQNEQDDYYLRRSIYKKYLLAGCIFSNDCNAKDFSCCCINSAGNVYCYLNCINLVKLLDNLFLRIHNISR